MHRDSYMRNEMMPKGVVPLHGGVCFKQRKMHGLGCMV